IVLRDRIEIELFAAAAGVAAHFPKAWQLAKAELQHEPPHLLEKLGHAHRAAGLFLLKAVRTVSFERRPERRPEKVGTANAEIEKVLQDVASPERFARVEKSVPHLIEHSLI